MKVDINQNADPPFEVILNFFHSVSDKYMHATIFKIYLFIENSAVLPGIGLLLYIPLYYIVIFNIQHIQNILYSALKLVVVT